MSRGQLAAIFAVLFVLTVCVFLFGSGNASKHEQSKIHKDEVKRPAGKRIPNGWTGLPISFDNKLFVDPEDDPKRYNAGYKSLYKILILMSDVDWETADERWERLLTRYESIIGWNGIFDVVNDAQTFLRKDSARRLHRLGEALFAHSTNHTHAVEVSARELLHKAPLHSAVWETIEEIGTSDINKLFEVINNDLCWFKTAKNMGNIWLSCM